MLINPIDRRQVIISVHDGVIIKGGPYSTEEGFLSRYGACHVCSVSRGDADFAVDPSGQGR